MTVPATEPPAGPPPERPAEPPAAPQAALSPPSPVDFIRDYYNEVAARDYDASWSQLAPEFQRGKAVSFDYYVGFWNENDVEVGEVAIVSSGERDATLHVDLRWNRSGSWLTDEFALRQEDGRWLIAAQKTLD